MKVSLYIAIATIAIIILTIVVWINAKSLNVRLAECVQSLHRYRSLADTMPQILWTAKPDGNLDYYNKRWFDYTGMTIEQTKDWGWKQVLHPDDLQNSVERWTKAYTSASEYEVEYRFKRASDGAYRWHLGRALPLRNQNGDIIQWVGTSTDIDDQKRARADLEQRVAERSLQLAGAKKKLEAVLEAAKPVKPLDGQAMRKLLGYGEDVLAEIIEIFVVSAPTSIADMGLALKNSSAADIVIAAHTLKGSCSNFGTSTLRDLCAQIEQLGQKGNIDGAGDLIVSAEKELYRLIKALEPYRKTKVPQ
jgi:PAS domain S-box-containing protein